MKKITILIALMMVSLGQTQTLRLGFEPGESGSALDPFGSMALPIVVTGTGSNTSKVLPIVANPVGNIWQGCNFVLTTPVQLTTTKTMTIDVLSSTPVTFLMKVNGGVGTAPEAAAQATHNGDGTWKTISFTFNTSLDGKAAQANGIYNKMVIHPFFPFTGTASARTFYIDNLSGPQAIVAPTLSNFAISAKSVGSSFQLTAPTTNSAGAFTYTSNNTAVATISGTTVSVVGVGNVIITATQAANGSYLAGSITAAFTATNLIIPTLGTLAVPNKVFGDAPFNLTPPTTNSGGAFTYTSSNNAVATISGSTVTIVGVGTSTITASQAATGNYATGSATATLTVNVPAAPTPTKAAEDVISIFSNTYTDLVNTDFYPNWGQSTKYVQENGMLKYSSLNYQGITFASPINGAAMEKLHIDVWTRDCTSFDMYIIDGTNPEEKVNLKPSFNGWNSYDIDLAQYTNLTKSSLVEFKIVGNGTVYLDNIYFWENLPAGTPVISFSIPAKSVSDAAFLLTPLITSTSLGAISYTSSNTSVATISGITVTIVGIGSTTITANQAANEPYIASTATATLIVNPGAAPVPQVNVASVIGLYGETYPPNGYAYDFGSVTTADLDPTSGVNNALKVDFNNLEYGQGFGIKDISAMQYVHFDYYTTDATTFGLTLLSDAPTPVPALYPISGIVKNQWVPVNIPMATFKAISGFNPAKFIQFKFGTATPIPGTVYFDNLYFSLTNPALGTLTFETSKVNLYPNPVKNSVTIDANGSIEKVSIYSILGQEVLSKKPNSNSTTLQTSSLQKGTYIVRSTIDGKTTTSKLIKE